MTDDRNPLMHHSGPIDSVDGRALEVIRACEGAATLNLMLPCRFQNGGTMGGLKGSQRKHLRGVAHSYKPLVQIGKEGLSEGVLSAIDTALEAHELIKVKIATERGERERFVPVIEERLACECVGTVGRIAILYREQPDPEKRKVTYPK